MVLFVLPLWENELLLTDIFTQTGLVDFIKERIYLLISYLERWELRRALRLMSGLSVRGLDGFTSCSSTHYLENLS